MGEEFGGESGAVVPPGTEEPKTAPTPVTLLTPAVEKPAATAPWYRENAAAIFSLIGVALTAWVTFQTSSISGRLKAIEDKNALAQSFQQTVFANITKLLTSNQPQPRLYLIGLYGQARGDEESKALVASIAAASCNPDLLRTLQALTTSETPKERQSLGVLITTMSQSTTCVPTSTTASNTPKAPVTAPPETIAARNALVASLTPVGTVGWMSVGTAPNGTENRDCIVLDPSATRVIDVLDATGRALQAQTLSAWGRRCAAEALVSTSPNAAVRRVVFPRDLAQLTQLRLHVHADRVLYTDHDILSPVAGIVKADSLVTFAPGSASAESQSQEAVFPVKGIDDFSTGSRIYDIWVRVEVQAAGGGNFAAPTAAASTSAAGAPTPASTSGPPTATPGSPIPTTAAAARRKS